MCFFFYNFHDQPNRSCLTIVIVIFDVGCQAPANFTVETFGAGDGELTLAAKGPNDVDYKVVLGDP